MPHSSLSRDGGSSSSGGGGSTPTYVEVDTPMRRSKRSRKSKKSSDFAYAGDTAYDKLSTASAGKDFVGRSRGSSSHHHHHHKKSSSHHVAMDDDFWGDEEDEFLKQQRLQAQLEAMMAEIARLEKLKRTQMAAEASSSPAPSSSSSSSSSSSLPSSTATTVDGAAGGAHVTVAVAVVPSPPLAPPPRESTPGARRKTYSSAEKLHVYRRVCALDPSLLFGVIKLLKEASPSSLIQKGDQVEIDVDALDDVALMELERYCDGHNDNNDNNKA